MWSGDRVLGGCWRGVQPLFPLLLACFTDRRLMRLLGLVCGRFSRFDSGFDVIGVR